MSGHLRFCYTAFALLAGLSTSSAFSASLSELFNAGPATAPARASAESECLTRPGKSTADGLHWVYRVEGQRRCWFQVAEGTETVKKLVQQRATKHRVATAEENKTAARERKAVGDARAELPRSAPADTSQPGPSVPAQVVDASPVLATGIATSASPAPFPNATGSRLTRSRCARSTLRHSCRRRRSPVRSLPLRRCRSHLPQPRRSMTGGSGLGLACC